MQKIRIFGDGLVHYGVDVKSAAIQAFPHCCLEVTHFCDRIRRITSN